MAGIGDAMHRQISTLFYAALSVVAISACGGGGGGAGGGSGSLIPATFIVSGLGTPSANGTYTLADATNYTYTVTETAPGGATVTPGPLVVTVSPAVGVADTTDSIITTNLDNATGSIKFVDSKSGRGVTLNVVVLTTHPGVVGDTLSLSGTLSHTIARPLPAPVAVALPTTTTSSVSQTTTVAWTDATYETASGLTELSASETDVAPLQTLGIKTMTYTRFQVGADTNDPSGELRYEAVAVASTDTNGVVDTTVYGGGAGVLDLIPDVNGDTFSNDAAQTFSEDDPDSTTVRRTVAADGTYAETDAYPGTGNGEQAQTDADLSGAITDLGGLPIDITYAAPTGTGAGASIGYTITEPGNPEFTTVTGSIADWFPTTTIYSDTAVKATNDPIPADCRVPSSVGSTATSVVETIKHLDTVLGTFENRVVTIYYAPGYGAVCAKLADGIDTYYDYTGQSPQTVPGINLSLNATPIQIDTIYETLGFVSANVKGASVARRPAQGLKTQAAIRSVAPIFNKAIESVYRERRLAMRAALVKALRR